MPNLIAQVTMQAGRVSFPPGSVVPIETEAEAVKLVQRGRAEFAAGSEPEAPEGDLPADIPARGDLIAAGITTLAALYQVDELTSIKGVGKATAEKIEDFLDASEESDGDDAEGSED